MLFAFIIIGCTSSETCVSGGTPFGATVIASVVGYFGSAFACFFNLFIVLLGSFKGELIVKAALTFVVFIHLGSLQ
jgi:hypothetical protein